ncbi:MULTISPECIES: DUF3558 domain-containing protein [Actinopolyspora]|uniref:DUF3558 domain-containing protein n=1 Tax=Actinopolyspora saharensis TaxID=995062 RepID=A0A1H0ZVX1_9ACTN|nr:MULTISPECIES: DUF3558 domain-containing protein [Actinopolyspora]NHD15559.1 DUF3558 domain-containing protein [Actinopolyspora sp. BKK2]NHE75227.1 DUF3558 domain-containing protein [Actinopolyspora sp. BKK1]SDQ31391.1 Protein of unknown function [Actinopolyspora saharensis]
MRNTITTSISLLAGILLLAGCGGQTDQTAQNTTTGANTPTSTSNAAGVNLPERTAPAKSLKLDNPCSIITQQQQSNLEVDQPTEGKNLSDNHGCDYKRGKSGSEGGWAMFVAADTDRTTQEFADKRPSGKVASIAEYPAYQVEKQYGCLVAMDVSDSGSLFVNGTTRLQTRAAPCSVATKFAESAIENLPNA